MAENLFNKFNEYIRDVQNDEIKSIVLGLIRIDWIYYPYIFNICRSRRRTI